MVKTPRGKRYSSKGRVVRSGDGSTDPWIPWLLNNMVANHPSNPELANTKVAVILQEEINGYDLGPYTHLITGIEARIII